MSYRIRCTLEVDWVGDGLGPLSVPGAQMKKIYLTGTALPLGPAGGSIIVPGANAPSGANFATAIDSAGTDLKASIAAGTALLAEVQGWATGGQ